MRKILNRRAILLLAITCAIALLVVSVVQRPFLNSDSTLAHGTFNDALSNNLLASQGKLEHRVQVHNPTDGNYVLDPSNTPSSESTIVPTSELEGASNETPSPNSFEPVRPAFDWLNPQVSIPQILAYAQANNQDQVYGWTQLQPGFNRENLARAAQNHDIEILEMTGLYSRVRLPANQATLQTFAAQPEIAGFGIQPAEVKVEDDLQELVNSSSNSDSVPVFIALMDADHNRSAQAMLEGKGAVIGRWFEDIRTYAANVPVNLVSEISQSDLVEQVALDREVNAILDSVSAVVGVDRGRTYSFSDGFFFGAIGQGITAGVLDTGLNTFHADLAPKNVCGVNYVSARSEDEQDLFLDAGMHGTHVTGIMAGGGIADPDLAGIAPGVENIRFGKVLNSAGQGNFSGIYGALEFMASPTDCIDAGFNDIPSVINVSLGDSVAVSNGRALSNRKLDSSIFTYRQAYVLAAGNSGSQGISGIGSAKNAILVGSSFDAGVASDFSSHGPTSDGRLAPHIVGPGSLVRSAKGDGSTNEYVELSGTSMSSPVVAGISVLLAEKSEEIKNNPALLRAVLMASAVRPDPWIGQAEGIAVNNSKGPGKLQAEYGVGFVSTTENFLLTEEYSMELSASDNFSQEIEVPDGVERLDIVLTWLEPPATAFSATVLANFDLYLDKDNDCETLACGDYSSESKIDSNEWLFIKAPEPGTYQLKVVPRNDFVGTMPIGVAVRAIDNVVPELSIVTAPASVDEDGSLTLEVSVMVDGHVSAGTTLHMVCRGPEDACKAYGEENVSWDSSSEARHRDRTKQSFGPEAINSAISIGEIQPGYERLVQFAVPTGLITKSHELAFVATAWNAKSAYTRVAVEVDGDEPSNTISVPVNDAIDQAIVLEGKEGTVEYDVLLATREPGERMLRTDGGGGGAKKFFPDDATLRGRETFAAYARNNSVWYKLDPESTGILSINGIMPQLQITMFDNTPDGLVVNSSTLEAPPGDGKSLRKFVAEVESGDSYFLQVFYAGYQINPGSFRWSIGDRVSPPNDNLADAIQLADAAGMQTGTNFGATLEIFENYGASVEESTWYSWKAPSTGNFAFNATPFRAVVFSGTDESNLRRISSFPVSDKDNFVRAQADESYYIVVLSGPSNGRVNDYELAWRAAPPEDKLAENDSFSAATDLASKSGEREVNFDKARTVDHGEPIQAGTASIWWKWNAPEPGSYSFTLEGASVQHLSVFEGASLEDLTLLGSGSQFVIQAEASQTYHLSLSVSKRFSFRDFENQQSQTVRISWGQPPENDTYAMRKVLSGSQGSATFSHAGATVDADDNVRFTGTHSLWWEWQAPSSGWYTFTMQTERFLPISAKTVDSVLGIMKAADRRSFIATTDQSYLLNGNPSATIYAIENESYVLRAGLRRASSLDPAQNTNFRWESDPSAPPWLGYSTHISGTQQASLKAPQSIISNPTNGKLYVNTLDAILEFSVDSTTEELEPTKTISYKDSEGNAVSGLDMARLSWDAVRSELYALTNKAIFHVQNLESNPTIQTCHTFTSEFAERTRPLSVVTDSKSEWFYILGITEDGDSILEVLKSTAACDFELEQTVDKGLDDFVDVSSIAMHRSGTAVYAEAKDGLLIFTRDVTSGRLTYRSMLLEIDRMGLGGPTDWLGATLTVSNSGRHLIVSGITMPLIAIYDIESSPASPGLHHSLGLVQFYYEEDFDHEIVTRVTQELIPDRGVGCVPAVQHKVIDAIDFLCDGSLITVVIEDNSPPRVVDIIPFAHSDRFRNPVQGFTFPVYNPAGLTVDAENLNVYIVSKLPDALSTFKRASTIKSDPY